MAEKKEPTWKVSTRLRSNARAHRKNSTDGGQHFSDRAEQADAARSAAIETKGFQVLRFGNHDVMTNRAGVLETIAAAVAARAPTLPLPRKREREKQLSPEKQRS
jgi:hypothetical protein